MNVDGEKQSPLFSCCARQRSIRGFHPQYRAKVLAKSNSLFHGIYRKSKAIIHLVPALLAHSQKIIIGVIGDREVPYFGFVNAKIFQWN